ncbi:MAG TPA: hypothetical protein PKD79_03060 [Candidatus Doudnabacteria bacterium]|nr:hypothetical protein [Candidatus Doudnabacteria bacterium]
MKEEQPKSEKNFPKRKSIHVNRDLTPEAAAIAKPQYEAAMNSPEMKAMVKRIEDSRRLSAKDMGFTCNTLDD